MTLVFALWVLGGLLAATLILLQRRIRPAIA
jgi:hypothetical protein